MTTRTKQKIVGLMAIVFAYFVFCKVQGYHATGTITLVENSLYSLGLLIGAFFGCILVVK